MSFAEHFIDRRALTDPGRDSFGAEALDVRVAGRACVFTGLDDALVRALDSPYASRPAPTAAAPAMRAEVRRATPELFLRFDTRDWELHIEIEHGATSLRFASLNLLAELHLTPRLEGVVWVPGDAPQLVPGALENYLRVTSSYLFLSEGGLLLHSAGLATPEGARLFVGRSGAGKSTLARMGLERGRRVLSDDLNVIWPAPGGYEAGAVPFAGDLRAKTDPMARHPVLGVHVLRQGQSDGVRPLPRAAALATLIACSPFVNIDPLRFDALAANVARLHDALPVNELTFSLGGAAWPTTSERAA